MRKIALPLAGIAFILTSILIAANQFSSSSGPSEINGTVTDAFAGSAVSGAELTLKGKNISVTADTKGNFAFHALEAGNYTVKCSAGGYADHEETVILKENETKTITIKMTASLEKVSEKNNKDEDKKETISGKASLYAPVAGSTSESIVLYDEVATGYDVTDGELSQEDGFNTEAYDAINENGFKKVIGNPLSTFSIDVDNASYSNIRRFISYGQTPPKDAVRIEEMINYFDYTYPQPVGDVPFSMNTEISDCPWNKNSKLVMVGLQGKDIDYSETNPSNLVFLIDVSGSMDEENKLPLVKQSLSYLIDNLNAGDKVAMVVYAGAAGCVLPSTAASDKATIKAALNKLEAGGSTAGGAGINLAYKIATDNFIKGGNNRVILCTDGDFNVGSSSDAEMTRLIEEKRKSGVFITICGFGMGNYKDSKMEKIADNGNGAYFYIDNEKEAKKVFVTDMRGTLFTIAKDVKIQVEFNPAKVAEYRLIGYEDRVLNKEDFDNDQKDAGELGAGHKVTALYEVVLANDESQAKGINNSGQKEDLKYQVTNVKDQAYYSDEILTLKLRYKKPDSDVSKLIEKSLTDKETPFAQTSDNFRFACGVTEFGMLLRDSEYKGTASYENVVQLANSAKGNDANGYRGEFIEMVKTFMGIAQK